ncbi:hypothetical protein MUDAN_BIHEEGNE_03201 [Lactiplantibacillus mudanjiangensis]|uniref:hypothetical protein n=1 Tax=Lactiplantibacillus mudanjiangensis TaxID=1296538 RepID=UPI001015C9A3|nr:hypothetical protein MUDAN_BIHEEGNE_03201 [Lactiplantibacillus mudanjiangensis]
MKKAIPKVYICGVIDSVGRVCETRGQIYRFQRFCQDYCDALNGYEHSDPKFQVLVADNWRLIGGD